MTAPAIPDAALAKHIAILGKTGAGKTTVAKSIVERLLDRGERVCVVDPTDVWWGLRVLADGRTPSGYPVAIVGGDHADAPIAADMGERLAAVAGGSSTPLVVVTIGLSVAGRTALFTAFAEELLRANRGPLHLVIDEAHLFAPQGSTANPQAAGMLHAANSLVALGRSRGLRITLISQRPAKLHKDSLTQVETLLALRLIGPQDRKAVEAWIGDQADKDQGAALVASLPTLATGEGWIWSPEAGVLERAQFPRIRTFDSSRPLGAGEAAPVLPPIAAGELRAALASGEPESKTTRKGVSRPDLAETAAAKQLGYATGYGDGLRDGEARGWSLALVKLDELWSGFRSAAAAEAPAPPIAIRPSSPGEITETWAEKRLVEETATPAKVTAAEAAIPAAMSPTARRILDVLEGVHPLTLTFKAAAIRAGASPRSSQFRAYGRELLESGLIQQVGDRLQARIARPGKRVTSAQAVNDLIGKLSPSQGAMLKQIWSHRRPLTRDEVADFAEVSRTSSGLGQGLRELVAMELIERLPDGRYRLSPALRDDPEKNT